MRSTLLRHDRRSFGQLAAGMFGALSLFACGDVSSSPAAVRTAPPEPSSAELVSVDAPPAPYKRAFRVNEPHGFVAASTADKVLPGSVMEHDLVLVGCDRDLSEGELTLVRGSFEAGLPVVVDGDGSDAARLRVTDVVRQITGGSTLSGPDAIMLQRHEEDTGYMMVPFETPSSVANRVQKLRLSRGAVAAADEPYNPPELMLGL